MRSRHRPFGRMRGLARLTGVVSSGGGGVIRALFVVVAVVGVLVGAAAPAAGQMAPLADAPVEGPVCYKAVVSATWDPGTSPDTWALPVPAFWEGCGVSLGPHDRAEILRGDPSPAFNEISLFEGVTANRIRPVGREDDFVVLFYGAGETRPSVLALSGNWDPGYGYYEGDVAALGYIPWGGWVDTTRDFTVVLVDVSVSDCRFDLTDWTFDPRDRTDADACNPNPPLQVRGVSAAPRDGGALVSWEPAVSRGAPPRSLHRSVSQYRVHAEDEDGEYRRVYTDGGVHETVVDGLTNGVEHTVTVTALTSRGGVEGPASEPVTVTPSAAARAPDLTGECPAASEPTTTHGVQVADCERGVSVTWRGAGQGVTQYRVVARVTWADDHDPAGPCARPNCDRLYSAGTSTVFERLEKGREYGVTVTAIDRHDDEVTSEPVCVVPKVGGVQRCDPGSAMMLARRFGSETDRVPALPLAAAALLAALLAAAGARRSRHPS